MLSGSLRANSADGGTATLDFFTPDAVCATVTIQSNLEDPHGGRLKLLSEGERDCLRLVFQHMTSKDIARQLGISHHAVDMRLRNAIRKLEVQSRIEAARILVSFEGGVAAKAATADYQALIYQAPELEDLAASGDQQEPASTKSGALPSRLNDPNLLEPGPLASAAHQMQFNPGVGPSGGFLAKPGALTGNVTLGLPLGAPLGPTIATERPGVTAPDPGDNARPFLATKPWGARNDLAIGQRIAWIMCIAFGSALTFGGVLAAFAALKSLI